ncbi:hypothetical protein FPOA_08076 [Fusarium poae]|uniref:Uncharacterized protein n=1 Tax=Fusarium poae TaxID=36050 RepID=A0A1B8AME9_FUSPO|nr:hypothetical protein FPOA_08076 [Fusarium poae]
MALTQDQEREIYLAYKDIFNKNYSQLRRLKGVQQRINDTRNQPIVQTSIGKYGKNEVVKTIRVLLEAKVFESEKIAGMRFSKGEPSPPPTLDPLDLGQKGVTFTNLDLLLGTSPDPVETREPLKIEREEDIQASQVCGVSSAGIDERLSSTSHLHEQELETLQNTTTLVSPITSKGNSTNMAALKGSRLGSTLLPIVNPPFKTQHLILKRMQTILEHVCFNFAKDNMPEILINKRWDCPEAGELDIWVIQFKKRLGELERRACSKGIEVSLGPLLNSISNIRHLAVHRRLIHANHLALLSSHAVVFCTLLDTSDAGALSTLQTVRDSVEIHLSALSDLKHDIGKKLDNALEEMAARREELDALEQKIIQEAHDKLESHQTIAWNKVDRLLPYRYNEPYPLNMPKPSSVGGVQTMLSLWSRSRLFLGHAFYSISVVVQLLKQHIAGYFHTIRQSNIIRYASRVFRLILFISILIPLLASVAYLSLGAWDLIRVSQTKKASA